MNLPWYTARAAGLVAWVLLAASVTWGFLLATRVLGRKPSSKWLLDLHRFMGGLATVFVGLHLVGLLADSYVTFTPTQLLVPFTSTYRPLAVAWGIVAFYLLLAVELTSLAKRYLPLKLWRYVHWSSYPLFVLATVHLLTSGTDGTNPVLRTVAIITLVEASVLVGLRVATRPAAPVPRGARPGSVDQPVK